MSEAWMDSLSEEERASLGTEEVPDWTAPMLATLTHESFSDPDWIYERKLDGVRCLVFKEGDAVRILSRNRKRREDTFPELLPPLRGLHPKRLVLDGEIVSFDGKVTSFSRLQRRIGVAHPGEDLLEEVPVVLYLFDLLHMDGQDLTRLPLRRRKSLLERNLAFGERLHFCPHRNAEGEAYLEEACAKGWEGLIAKRAASPYVHARSRDWLKFKCSARQEFVIAGFTEPAGARVGFGSLLLGYHDDDGLRSAGRVGTGFDDALLRELREKMDHLERETSPFVAADARKMAGDAVHWITPRLVGEVAFTEWTREGRLRHPRFLGLRDDKDAGDVVREGGSP